MLERLSVLRLDEGLNMRRKNGAPSQPLVGESGAEVPFLPPAIHLAQAADDDRGMPSLKRPFSGLIAACVLVALLPSSAAAELTRVPDWAKPAVNYLVEKKLVDRETFQAEEPMTRRAFGQIMKGAFGGGFSKTRGKVTAGEVSATLVRALGRKPIADALSSVKSPDGWDPEVAPRFGTEVVARELGLRHDRPTTEEASEASEDEPMRQADVAWAVWKALTAPSTYSADVLANFKLDSYKGVRRTVVKFALSLVGTPYVWGGEWTDVTPAGYPFGAQAHGGVDCTGLLWYVLQQKSDLYSPIQRHYKGWSIPERTSSDMARATPKNARLGYKQLKAGDVLLFAPKGRDDKPANVYHAGMYLGQGWMIHSSGSRAGVSLGQVSEGSYWREQFLWGRRIIGT